MDQRRALLAILVLGATALGGYFGYTRFVAGPISQREKERTRAEQAARDAQDKLTQMKVAASDLADIISWCLPGDPQIAQERFQTYLFDLLESSNIPNATVSPRPPQKQSGLHVISFSIESETDLWSLVKFLHAFYSTPRLQQITELSLTPMERKDIADLLRFSMTIQAIALGDEDAPTRGSDVPFETPVDSTRDAFGVIVERNVLYAAGPGTTLLRAGDPEHVVLTSLLRLGKAAEADLFDRAQNTGKSVRVGDEFTVGRTRALVKDIGFRDMVLLIDGNLYLWELGTSFNTCLRSPLSAEQALDREVRNSRRMRTME